MRRTVLIPALCLLAAFALSACSPAAPGGWDFTGTELVKRDAPASIADPELSAANQDLADAVMFD